MNFGLKDFFMGVIHLFVIFLPGSLLLLTILVGSSDTKDFLESLPVDATGKSLIFIGTSYFLGHLVSMIGSALEDIVWRDLWKIGKKKKNKKETAKKKSEKKESKKKKFAWVRKIRNWREGKNELDARARKICRRELNIELDDHMQFRRWAQLLARHGDPEFRAEIDAKDADRRFFRNIRWVLFAPLILAVTKANPDDNSWTVVAILVLITVLAWLRYYDQDWKFTKLVYEVLILRDAKRKTKK